MLTIFATPKPFHGHISIIQHNAIQSWSLLQPQCEIILFGDEEGTSEAATEFRLRHVPQIARNELGLPLVSDLFEKACNMASHKLLCYVNSDIILMSDFMRAVQQVAALKPRFLMVGHRCNLDLREPVNFDRPDWQSWLKSEAVARGHLASEWCVDYFVFSPGIFEEIPPFAIGRPYFDSWLLWRARSGKVPVIDATPVVRGCIHQDHERRYSETDTDALKQVPDLDVEWGIKNNYILAAGGSLFTLTDATHFLTPRGLRWALRPGNVRRHLKTLPDFYPYLRAPIRWFRQLVRVARKLGYTGWSRS